MEVIRLPVYRPSQQEMDDPKLYASNVRRLMATEVFIMFLYSAENAFWLAFDNS